MRCRGLPEVANPAFLSGFLCSRLLRVAPYCVLAGIRVVSEVPGLRVASFFLLDWQAATRTAYPQLIEFTLHYTLRWALVSRYRARPRPPRSSSCLDDPQRRPASPSTAFLPTCSKKCSYEPPGVWVSNILPNPSPTFSWACRTPL